jgi:phage shock protein B
VPEVIVVPFILFVLFVAPLWLWLHYREKQRLRDVAAGLAAGPSAGSAELTRTAERLEQRVAALEALLDAESPDWRKRRE